MPKIRKKVIVKSSQGLHARPAALFVQVANKYTCDIAVSKDNEEVNGKSIMGILMLGAEQGSEVTITAIGEDAYLAVEELEKLLTSDEEEIQRNTSSSGN